LGSKPFWLVLPDPLDLHTQFENGISRQRAVLLGNAEDPGTPFIKTVMLMQKDAAYNQTTFYEAWRLTTIY